MAGGGAVVGVGERLVGCGEADGDRVADGRSVDDGSGLCDDDATSVALGVIEVWLGVGVDGTEVAVGDTGVSDGSSVALGGTGVSLDGEDVLVGGGIGVRVGTVWRSASWLGNAHTCEPRDRSNSAAVAKRVRCKLVRRANPISLFTPPEPSDERADPGPGSNPPNRRARRDRPIVREGTPASEPLSSPLAGASIPLQCACPDGRPSRPWCPAGLSAMACLRERLPRDDPNTPEEKHLQQDGHKENQHPPYGHRDDGLFGRELQCLACGEKPRH